MRIVDGAEQETWIRARGLFTTEGRLAIQSISPKVIGLRIPHRPLDCARLAQTLLSMDQENAEGEFQGGMVKVKTPMADSAKAEALGRVLLESLLSTQSNAQGSERSHASLLETGDRVPAAALLTVALLSRWDAWFVPNSGNHVVHIAPQGYVVVVARNEHDAELVQDWLCIGPEETAPATVTSPYL